MSVDVPPVAPDRTTSRLRLRGIRRTFGSVVAVDDVDLDVHAGTVHALLGENGAGKSTLMNVVFGVHRRDAGLIEVDGAEVDVRRPADAIAAGIAMVHQHHRLVPSLTVAETILLGRRGRGGRLDRAGAARRVRQLADELEITLDPRAVVGDLSLGGRQRVEILTAVHRDARLLVLDEPTAVLAPLEVDPLLALLRRIAESGCAVILISHRLREVFAVSDEISVMRRGRLVGTGRTSTLTEAQVLAQLVTVPAEVPTPRAPSRAAADVAPVLELRGLAVAPSPGSTGLQGLSLEVRPGEVVGIAGVEGNGQSDLVDVLAGIAHPSAGQVTVVGQPLTGRPGRDRLSLVPEDRHHQGLVLDLSTAENLALDHLGTYTRGGLLQRGAMRAAADAVVARMGVVTASTDAPVRSMSGGNQQKVVLARALAARPAVLVVSQPTRGLDPGAAHDVLERVRAAAAAGTGVLLISSDVDEVIEVSDRVVVMFAGAVAGAADDPATDRAALMGLMTGADRRSS